MQNLANAILAWRRPLVIIVHILLWCAAFAGAYLIRFDLNVDDKYVSWETFGWMLGLICLRLVAYERFALFQGMWRYTGLRDAESLVKATLVSTGLFTFVALLAQSGVPRLVFLLEFMLTLAFIGSLRYLVRTVATVASRIEHVAEVSKRLVIVGAGDAGEALLRELQGKLAGRYSVVGFLDDDPHKQGMHVHGVSVLGTINDAASVLASTEASEVVIAIPKATGTEMRRIVEACKADGVSVRTVPSVDRLIDGQVTVSQLREVNIEDLLGRDPVKLDEDEVSDMLRRAVVLVTGAGGSIGSELCRQICRYHPRKLVLVEQAENSLYQINRELLGRFPDLEIVPVVADVCDEQRLDVIFGEHQPELVFHAAAHKHVPMMECNPGEAVKNNIGGSRAVARAAHQHGVLRFVMISTDKAVNPTSVMGCTKRVAELYVQSFAQVSTTRFVTVRFGNVLGSAGSVIPLFREQISRGGPVTVTHPDMIRYFMTIPEAAQLVTQAGAFGASGEIYVLDMGEPVKILTLAEDLIRLSGLRPYEDIPITFSGIRPGEKLFEELSTDSEQATKTKHPKIFVGTTTASTHAEMETQIERLLAVSDGIHSGVRMTLRDVVPEFTGVRPGDDGASTMPAVEERKVIPITAKRSSAETGSSS